MPIHIGEFSPSEPRGKEGIVFELAGETFTTLPEIPAGVMNDFLAAVNTDPRGNRIYSLPNLMSFLTGILRDEEPLTPEEAAERGITRDPDADGVIWTSTDDVRRFEQVVYGKRHIVKMEQLGDLVVKIGESLGERPTRPSGRSAPGR